MLHRNTNKITLILVYAILEWTLIVLLLLNSLFSYLIIKYAEYFGLKKPCLWCSRLDHIFDSTKRNNSYRDLVCCDHGKEISKLGFCSNHQRLSESKDMCEGCSSSSQPDFHEFPNDFAYFPWMKQIGMIQGPGEVAVENGEVDSKCSCCGVGLERKFYSPYVLIKPSWEVLDYTLKGNLVGDDDRIDDGDHSNQSGSEFVSQPLEEVQRIAEDIGILIEGRELEIEENCSGSVSNSDCKEVVANEDDEVDVILEEQQQSIKEEEPSISVSMTDPSYDESKKQESCAEHVSPQVASTKHLEFYIDGEDCHLIPIELMDPSMAEMMSGYKFREEEKGNGYNEDVILDFTMHDVGTQVELVVENAENRCSPREAAAMLPAHESEEETKAAELEAMEVDENEWSPFIQAEDAIEEGHEQVAATEMPQTASADDHDDVQASDATAVKDEELESDFNQVSDDVLQMHSDEFDAEVSIGTDIPDQEPIDDTQRQEIFPQYQCTEEDPFATPSEMHAVNDNHGCKKSEDDNIEFKAITVETSEQATVNHLSLHSDFNEIDEEKAPDTPTSIDSLHHLHKKLLLLDRRESGAEDSLDGGSVISDIDAGDGVLTVEKLKSALRAERKALNALYSELEEERSASAVAANQTMAMINRLQEEKAAMQMEALQYQRMMEEQSEYDQEALQLLNELMVKREREKAEIEKELEFYRKKVQDYEAREKIMMLRRSRRPSASCSNAEDSDDVSIDLNHEAKEEDGFDNQQESNNQNTPADAVLYLKQSVANFEVERLCILGQLKVLEEKLFTLNDEEEQHFEDTKPIDHLYKENGNGYSEDQEFESEANGTANGHFKEMNGKHYQERKNIGSKAKRLLPLFDAIDAKSEDGVLNGDGVEFDSVSTRNSYITKFVLDSKRLAIEEEVDHVHERLLALEADREFLKHCMRSLRKGDKGIHLLQEILQHLHDLRSVERQARNMGDIAT